jgi:glycosyltransferase involved in cell wall biosynthesis
VSEGLVEKLDGEVIGTNYSPVDPMKILLVAPPWVSVPPKGYGGTELMLDVLARGLAKRGHKVILAATGDSECDVERVWIHPKAIGTDKASPLAEVLQVMEAYKHATDVDIVHDHTVVGPIMAQGAIKAPIVTTNHGPFTGELAEYYRRIGDSVPVIAISKSQAAMAADIPIAAIIHHGIEMERIPVGDGSGGYAAFLGRMHPDKGVHRAIELARKAGVALKIAAKMKEPHEFDYYEQVVKPMLGGNVEYVGEIGGDEKYRFLGDAFVLLNPIDWPEPFGLVMIEAMAAGTPVVATGAGAATEIVTEEVTGYLANDDRSLVKALGKATNLNRNEVRAHAQRMFGAERMVADHERLYRRLIASADRGRTRVQVGA